MRERLLERLSRAESGANDPGRTDSQIVLQSVQRHLALLLNTQQGSVSIAPDYGIPDFFSLFGLGDVEALANIERLLEQTVQKYEPRLHDVNIRVVSKDSAGLNLHLQLLAKLPVDGGDVNVSFDTVFDAGGRVTID